MKLSIGSGHRKLPGWVHLDIEAECRPHVLADITRPLPFADRSIDLVFCEEVVTQVPLEACGRFVAECRRVLKPAGAVRVLTPDLRRFVTTYLDDPEGLVRIWNDSVGLPLALGTAGEVINQGMRLVGPFMYDLETFTAIAEPAGFEVRVVAYCESEHPELRGLDLRKPDETMSMYLELWPAGA
jgi:SAM-dependent methyltransferase